MVVVGCVLRVQVVAFLNGLFARLFLFLFANFAYLTFIYAGVSALDHLTLPAPLPCHFFFGGTVEVKVGRGCFGRSCLATSAGHFFFRNMTIKLVPTNGIHRESPHKTHTSGRTCP